LVREDCPFRAGFECPGQRPAERYDPVVESQGPVQGIPAGTVFMGDRILWWDSAALRMMSFGG